MAKTDVELQALESPKSRNEEFFNYICGRATNVNALPKPESRIEEYLEYIAYNGLGGGGGPGAVISVNGKTGDVILTATDVEAIDSIEQTEDVIKLKSGTQDKANIEIITIGEIDNIINNLI